VFEFGACTGSGVLVTVTFVDPGAAAAGWVESVPIATASIPKPRPRHTSLLNFAISLSLTQNLWEPIALAGSDYTPSGKCRDRRNVHWILQRLGNPKSGYFGYFPSAPCFLNPIAFGKVIPYLEGEKEGGNWVTRNTGHRKQNSLGKGTMSENRGHYAHQPQKPLPC